jgi:hypothetical protein
LAIPTFSAHQVLNQVQSGHVTAIGSGGTIQTDCFATDTGFSLTYHAATIGDPTWIPVVGDACNVEANPIGIGTYVAYPLSFRWPDISYKSLQSIIMNLAAWFFTTDPSDRTGDDYTNDIGGFFPRTYAYAFLSDSDYRLDYTTFPADGGWVRYREPETSALNFINTYANGDRARFVWNAGGSIASLIEPFYAGFPLPFSSAGDKQYSGKIMRLAGGFWVVDEDQVTPLPLRQNTGDVWRSGDVLVRPNADQLLSAIKSLVAVVRTNTIWEAKYKPAANNDVHSDNTTIFSCAASKAMAEGLWGSAAETDGFPANNGSYYNVGNPFGGQWQAAIRTMRTRMNDVGFQTGDDLAAGPGPTAIPLSHTFQSAIDLYMVTGTGATGSDPFYLHRHYNSPVAGMVENQWNKVQTLPPSAADARNGDWIGGVLPPAPACVNGEVHSNEWVFKNSVAVQRFNVIGGFSAV